ncbi:hypothetical protein [Pseudoalteromonas rubra]|uniref:Lipoprotein n=1 Tax=Pseudoalteromonas rubra TaxID=43658 RepID=A0A0U3I5L7_9GAMM|nr:hypothetical protein [Pseudoalteromonas rubra]ALU45334.1 hypothetical protein AT705_20490 [Pseudoalteromonas rubra]
MTRLKPIAGLWLLSIFFVSGCMFAPQDTQYYDPKCKMMLRKKTLTSTQIHAVSQCRGDACALVLAGFGLASAASLVVSGTIVIAANTVSWLEKAKGCPASPAPQSNGREQQADLDT